MNPVDPIKFEVIRNALMAATEEMAIALRRSAYSTNIKTRSDFSCAIFDRHLQTVAQAFTQPAHLGSLVQLVPKAITVYGKQNIHPGDALLINDPYQGGVHLNDISLISPVYLNDDIFGYVASVAHHVDVGGGAPASVGAFREVYQEGIIIPPIKLVSRGEIVDDVFRLVLGQIRSKRETAGDFRAQIASNNTGARRLVDLAERMGADVVDSYTCELVDYTNRRTRAEVSKLPKGVFTSKGHVDNDGFTTDPVGLQATITIDNDGVLFDLSGCDPQRRAPVNSTYSQTFAACAYVYKCLMDPDVPVNSGFYQSLRITAPEGTVVNCRTPAPVVGGWETAMRLIEVMFNALAKGLPDRIPAGCKGTICHAGFGGHDPVKQEYFCYLETVAGGYGGRASSDGPDAIQPHMQNTENAPIEETEINYPLQIKCYELIEDSEGAGRFRGGLGLRRDYLFPDTAVSFTVLADRDRWGPGGLFGGLAGRKASYLLKSQGKTTDLGSKTTVQLQPGDIISFRTCGGGGHGPPVERDPQLVLRDVQEGKISAERARTEYKVAIETQNWFVQQDETHKLRMEPTGS